jgi:hypothetical protein
MFYKVEHVMTGKVDDILAWLEKDVQFIENYDNEKIRVIFRAEREGNKIVVSGTLYEINDASMPLQISDFGACEGFTFKVSRISDERSKIEGLIVHQNMFVEKLYYTYLARLGDAFDTAWREDARKIAESLRKEIEKKQGWHWGTVEKINEETGQQWTYHGAKIPNEPEPVQNNETTPYTKENDNLIVGFDISGSFEIPVEWDILVSISHKCLDGYARGFVEKEIINKLPASTSYRIWQEQLGELGMVEITKLRAGFSEIRISGVPLDSADNSPMWKKIEPEWDKKKRDTLKENLSRDESMTQYGVVLDEIYKIKAEITAKQKDHQAGVIKAYFNRLVQEVGIWKPKYPPLYVLTIAGFTSGEEAYKRGKYFGDFINNAWEAANSLASETEQANRESSAAKPGRWKLSVDDPDEFIYRLAKAQEGNEFYEVRKGNNFTWRDVCKKIGWRYGSSESAVKLLYYARLELRNLEGTDLEGWLPKIKEFREKEKKKNE